MQWIVQALKAQRERLRRVRDGDAAQSADPRDPHAGRHAGGGLRRGELSCRVHARPRFGLLVFIDRMVPLFDEQIAGYGLATRSVGARPVGFTFQDVLPAFAEPAPLIERFRTSARGAHQGRRRRDRARRDAAQRAARRERRQRRVDGVPDRRRAGGDDEDGGGVRGSARAAWACSRAGTAGSARHRHLRASAKCCAFYGIDRLVDL